MSDLQDLEDKLKKKKYEKSLFETMINTFSLWIDEAKKTIGDLVWAPKEWDNQISKELEEYEVSLINRKK